MVLPRGWNRGSNSSIKKESPVLAELNEIREILSQEKKAEGSFTNWDMSVHDKADFRAIAETVLPEGKYTKDQIDDAYHELHLISEMGGSHGLSHQLIETAAQQGPNAEKYLLQYIEPAEIDRMVQDNISRRSVGAAMYGNWSMLPVRDTAIQANDTRDALEKFIATTRSNGEKGEGLYQIGNSGFRSNKPSGSALLQNAYVQNFNDKGRGWDRFSRDPIFNQKTEFGHYDPIEGGGLDESSNGRMQAMSSNKATRDKLGVQGMLRAYGPSYFSNEKSINSYLEGLTNIDKIL